MFAFLLPCAGFFVLAFVVLYGSMGVMDSTSKKPVGGVTDKAVCSHWYVSDECIACDACVLVADKHFAIDEKLDRAIILRQPQNSKEVALCQEALEACPVEAIHHKPITKTSGVGDK